MSAFAAGLLILWVETGWFDADVVTNVPFGVAPVDVSPAGVAIGIALLAASHLVRRLSPRRRIAPRVALDLGDDGSYRSAPTATTATLNVAQLRAAEIARRHVGLAWSLVFSLAIAGVGFWAPGAVGFHGPRQHPMEWWVFFAASVVAVASHAPYSLTFSSRSPAWAASGSGSRVGARSRREYSLCHYHAAADDDSHGAAPTPVWSRMRAAVPPAAAQDTHRFAASAPTGRRRRRDR